MSEEGYVSASWEERKCSCCGLEYRARWYDVAGNPVPVSVDGSHEACPGCGEEMWQVPCGAEGFERELGAFLVVFGERRDG